jgi:hypothetical protein
MDAMTILEQVPDDASDMIEDPIVKEAQEEFQRAIDWEDFARKNFRWDWMFHNADSENGFQWPDEIRQTREIDAKPCLTINHTRQHNLMLINELIDNRPSITVKPVGDSATKAASEVWEGIIRRIEYQSQANDIYETAVTFMVAAGIGYIRVYTDWENDQSFDQSLYLGPVNDPLTIVMDPDMQSKDGSDANFVFVFRKVLKEDLEKKYPKVKGRLGSTPLGFNDAWVSKDYCLEVEYWKRKTIKDTMYEVTDPKTGEKKTVLKSKSPDFVIDSLEQNNARKRKIERTEVWRYLIAGDMMVEKNLWPGQYIPIIRVPGEEYSVDGVMDRRGHTRAMKDPQRMYNYWTSSAVENVALQSKVPWLAAQEATEGYETIWENANNVNYSVLPYNALGDDGVTTIPAPTRPQPPIMAQAYLQGMQVSQNEIMAVSGQREAAMGQADNERTGAAIEGRQSRSDMATSHFARNFGMALRHLGRVIMDVVPHVYDVERAIHIMAENGASTQVTIDPTQKVHLQMVQAENLEGAKIIFNPKMGDYAVEADLGPGYATKREQSFRAFTQILTQAPALTNIIGDIMLQAGDFPGAEEAAERLQRMVPAQAMGTGPTPQEQQMQKEIQQLQQLLAQQHQEIAEAKLRATGKTDLRQVEAYNAETKRMEVLRQAFVNDPAELQQIIHQLVQESLATVLAPPQGQEQAPAPMQQSGPPPAVPPQSTGIQVPLGQPLPGAPAPIQVNPNG